MITSEHTENSTTHVDDQNIKSIISEILVQEEELSISNNRQYNRSLVSVNSQPPTSDQSQPNSSLLFSDL